MGRFPDEAHLADLAAVAGTVDAGDTGRVVVQHTVTGPDGDVTWHVRLQGGRVEVIEGAASDADVTIVEDAPTARAIAAGDLTPAAAFAAGCLRVGGRVGALVEHHDAIRAAAAALAEARR